MTYIESGAGEGGYMNTPTPEKLLDIQAQYAELGLDAVLDTLIAEEFLRLGKNEIYQAVLSDKSGKLNSEIISILDVCGKLLDEMKTVHEMDGDLDELLSGKSGGKIAGIRLTIAEKVAGLIDLIRQTK